MIRLRLSWLHTRTNVLLLFLAVLLLLTSSILSLTAADVSTKSTIETQQSTTTSSPASSSHINPPPTPPSSSTTTSTAVPNPLLRSPFAAQMRQLDEKMRQLQQQRAGANDDAKLQKLDKEVNELQLKWNEVKMYEDELRLLQQTDFFEGAQSVKLRMGRDWRSFPSLTEEERTTNAQADLDFLINFQKVVFRGITALDLAAKTATDETEQEFWSDWFQKAMTIIRKIEKFRAPHESVLEQGKHKQETESDPNPPEASPPAPPIPTPQPIQEQTKAASKPVSGSDATTSTPPTTASTTTTTASAKDGSKPIPTAPTQPDVIAAIARAADAAPTPTSASSSTTPTPTALAASTATKDSEAVKKVDTSEEDAKDLKYVIGLLANAPVPPLDAGEGSRTLVMTSKGGKKFRCTIPHPSSKTLLDGGEEEDGEVITTEPNVPALVATSSSTTSTTPSKSAPADTTHRGRSAGASTPSTVSSSTSATTKAATPAPKSTPAVDPHAQLAYEISSIPRLIRQHLGDGCFNKPVDFWSYELCAFKKVRQYHKKSESEGTTMEFSLGSYVAAADIVKAEPTSKLGTKQPPLQYTQFFDGGTGNRASQVTFVCNTEPNPKLDARHVLTTIREPKPFHYEFEVRTTLLCRNSQGLIDGIGSVNQEEPANKKTAASSTAKSSSASSSSPANAEGVETGRTHTSRAGKTAANSVANALNILDPLGDSCLYLNLGWWTYKFCYLKEIAQFHRETVQQHIPPLPGATSGATAPAKAPQVQVKTGARSAEEARQNIENAAAEQARLDAAAQKAGGGSDISGGSGGTPAGTTIVVSHVITAQFILGLINVRESMESIEGRTMIVKGDSWDTTYLSHVYSGGTECDLNHRPRSTEARIFCDIHEGSSFIKSVVESATCEYIMIIHTPLICTHPLFKPNVPKVVEITCEPIIHEVPIGNRENQQLNLK